MLRLLRPASIRGRLILLVLAIWVPAVAGLGLQAVEAYQSQRQSIQDEMQQQALSLRLALDAEVDRRHTLARTLTAMPALAEGDLARFERAARLAVRDSQDVVLLVDRERQYFRTDAEAAAPVDRGADARFVTQGIAVEFVRQAPVTGQPEIDIFVPEAGRLAPRYNVGVSFPSARIQEVIAQQPLRPGSMLSVIDGQQRVMGRSRDIQRWLGTPATHPVLRELAAARGSGFLPTTTLDKVASLTYLSPPGPHGWATVVALPEQTLSNAAWALALRAVAASAVLLAIGLGLAILAARRISGPVKALERRAEVLLEQKVPPPLKTGFREVDRVGDVLHEAGLRARRWEDELQARVAQASAEARHAEASLFEARKHEAIGRLTGAIAHDFNNLLQTISMGLQVVHRSVPEGKYTKALLAAVAATGRAGDQVRQMLAFGRAQQLNPRPVNLVDLLLRSGDLTDKALGERVRLVVDVSPELPPLRADPVQLELSLLNLVFNARDAMVGSGRVTLRAVPAASVPAVLPPGPYVRIDVEDDGPGMDAPTLARVFEPYFTTKPVGAGTGLGLPQVQSFARQSGGEVEIASTPGAGTRVTLYLPVADAPAVSEAAQERHARRSERRLRVLMVEDDVLVAQVVLAALEHEGHGVRLCRTADEAQQLLAAGEAAEVLFTDVMMPGVMTGLELVEWCEVHRPDVPPLVTTGYTARAPRGAVKVLRKPYTIEELLDALDACASGAPVAAH
jgi:signal transduction histidine kinase/ActR/RegA family two-component response regulator